MILDELVLHDFGVYAGRQTLTLTPQSRDRPIVLVGGLNGGGKTTILEALQLCLFGAAALTEGRGAGGYEEHLRRRINRSADVREAGIELAFRHTSDGVEQSFRVVRSWSVGRTGGCRETLEILRDGKLDKLATANWAEKVEEFMPARIASLFLFDGEKVESYADPNAAPGLIASAVHNLLGLDIVERLSTDLSAFERRKRSDVTQAADGASPADEARAALEEKSSLRSRLLTSVAGYTQALDSAERNHKRVDEKFRREGGDLYERRLALEADAVSTERQAQDEDRHLRDLAAGHAPLLMVADLVAAVAERAAEERETSLAAGLAARLQEEYLAVLDLPHIKALPQRARAEIEAALTDRLGRHTTIGMRDVHLSLSSEAALGLADLAESGLEKVREEVEAQVDRTLDAHKSAEAAARALAAIPTADAIMEVSADRARLQLEVANLTRDRAEAEAKLSDLDREILQLREREARLAESEALERFRGEDADRAMLNSARVRGTLLRFREAVIAQHLSRIESLVLESFQRLVRKPGLITGLTIDRGNFSLQLIAADGGTLMPEQLSAGERQLLAVAILWGLAKASGRPLPTVIDTPLGRLDSHHRSRLVERYFPHASHQVILLSTDEEISGPYYEALVPWIGRSYRLDFDEASGGTTIGEGYLPQGDHLYVA